MPQSHSLPKVKILSLGGTISAHHSSRLELRQYKTGHYTGQDLLDALPELQEIAQVDVEQLDNITSTGIRFEHWVNMRQRIHDVFEEGYDGVVITHGTNTIEETAYFLNLTVNSDKPVVITGSQRPFSALSTDATFNVINSVRVAASPQCQDLGVLVVFNDAVYAARDVTKTHTYHVETFQSPNAGPLGTIDADGKVRVHYQPLQIHTSSSTFAGRDFNGLVEPYIPVLYSHAGADHRLIDAIMQKEQPAAFILAGTGAGRVAPLEIEALARAREQGVEVVMSSRLATGRVLPIEEYDRLGLLTADNLPPHKARILMMLGILFDFDTQGKKELFEHY